jgi:hypothetical protein
MPTSWPIPPARDEGGMSRELVDTKRELEAAKNDYTRIGWDVVERGLRGSWGGISCISSVPQSTGT